MRKCICGCHVGSEFNDSGLCVFVGCISHFALQDFTKVYSGRFYNVGICEPTIISMITGLFRSRICYVVHTIAPVIVEQDFDQMKLDFCYHELGGNLIFCRHWI